MYMIIYKITNKINGKVYIGQTTNTLDARWQQHINKAKRGIKTHFYSAIRKYGEENFIPDIICEVATKSDLNLLETYYIQKYNSIKDGYNMVDGGSNNVMCLPDVRDRHLSRVQSKENRKKISISLKKKIARGEFFTAEHRKHLSESAMGNHNFGTGDTRSIPCYCIDNGVRRDFKNYKEAGIWWYNTYHPFGEHYSQATYQRKIIDCIETGECMYRTRNRQYLHITRTDIEWYRKEGDVDE